MGKIAVLITDLFEDSEYSKPAKAFQDNGHGLTHISTEKKQIKGKDGTSVDIDLSINQAHANDFDALFIPGGFSPDQLRADDRIIDFVRDFADTSRPILLICHGPQVLINADLLRGRTITGWRSIQPDLRNAGANVVDQQVVVDGNLVSSRQPDDIPAFIDASIRILEQTRSNDASARSQAEA